MRERQSAPSALSELFASGVPSEEDGPKLEELGMGSFSRSHKDSGCEQGVGVEPGSHILGQQPCVCAWKERVARRCGWATLARVRVGRCLLVSGRWQEGRDLDGMGVRMMPVCQGVWIWVCAEC